MEKHVMFSSSTRDVLTQVVRDPSYRKLASLPTFAWQTITLLLASYTLFGLATYMFIIETIHWSLALCINWIAAYMAFTVLHDATHRSCSLSPIVNNVLGTLATFFLLPGVTVRLYRYLHLTHHRCTGDDVKDPDELLVSVHWSLVPFVLPFVDIVWVTWYVKRLTSRPTNEQLDFWLGIVVFYVGWHVIWLLSPYALEFVLLWMIPQRLGLFSVAYCFARIQHPKGIKWEDAPFQSTYRIQSNALQRKILLGQGVHCLHHFLPNIPFYRYQQAWEAGRLLFDQQNIPVSGILSRNTNITIASTQAVSWIKAQVISRQEVAHDISMFEFEPALGHSFPEFSAGAHIDVQINAQTTRQYSLCNSPSDRNRYVIAVKKEIDGRGGSLAMHQTVNRGSELLISAPRNFFKLNDNATDYVLVAGGIGLTPILSMAYYLYESGKPFTLHICVRNSHVLPFNEVLNSLPFKEAITVYFSDDDKNLIPQTDIGQWNNGQELYVCGPAKFMEWIKEELQHSQWPNQNMFSEAFSAPAPSAAIANKPFEVELARTGKILQVSADESLLDVLNNHGCGVISSCMQGVCGSCITPVMAGEPEHRDAILTDEERQTNSQMCVCVSRAISSKIVLDL
jgi:ferredoxin-NADP reductase/fatty acid desaturase